MATKTRPTWRIGLDLGFTMSGAVLCRGPSDPVAWELHQLRTGRTTFDNVRAQSLATTLVNCVMQWIDDYSIDELEIAIETPVYKRNPATLMLQLRLLQEVETGLVMLVPSMCKRSWITEVNPSTSKKLLTRNGRAEKPQMVANSPWSNWKTEGVLRNFDQAHTLADAWAHAMSAPVRQHDLNATRLVANTMVLDWRADD